MLFKKLEVSAPCCGTDEERAACYSLLAEARKILKDAPAGLEGAFKSCRDCAFLNCNALSFAQVEETPMPESSAFWLSIWGFSRSGICLHLLLLHGHHHDGNTTHAALHFLARNAV